MTTKKKINEYYISIKPKNSMNLHIIKAKNKADARKKAAKIFKLEISERKGIQPRGD